MNLIKMSQASMVALSIVGLAGVTTSALCAAALPASSDGLVAVQSRTFDEFLIRPDANLASYHKIIVDPATVALKKNWLKDMNAQRDLQRWLVPEDAQRITDEGVTSLNAVVVQTFKERGYEVATAPGEGVLRLSASVTDLYVNAPYVPSPGIQRAFVRDGGQATLRLEVRDSVTGTVLAQIVDRELAREIRLNNMATGVSNLFWFEALFRQWTGYCINELEKPRIRETADARP